MSTSKKGGDAGKDAIISKIYYDVASGFGSIAETLRKVREVDKSITKEEVKRFLDKQEVRQKKKPARYNSFVPAGRLEQIQTDLSDFGKPRTEFRYGLVAIDIFSKHLTVVPIHDKTSSSTSAALDRVAQTLGMPATVLTDEGGEFQGDFQTRLRYYEIDHVVSRTPPIFVEREPSGLKKRIWRFAWQRSTLKHKSH